MVRLHFLLQVAADDAAVGVVGVVQVQVQLQLHFI
jgi:hypothetical protein